MKYKFSIFPTSLKLRWASNFQFSMKYVGFIFVLLVSIIPLLDLLHPGLPITHDGQDHVARIANFYRNLEEGILVPRWGGNLNWGYGHPVLMFLYPLPSYFSSLFHYIGFSFIDSVKLVFATAFVLSGLTMYLWMRNILGNTGGLVAGALYMFAPYRFVDLYVRGAIGEHIAFIFPPLILYFLLKLSKKNSYWYFLGGCLSFAGLILSHNAISIMFLPFILFYMLYLLWSNKNRLLLISQYAGLLILGFGLSSFFLVPAFLEGKYTLRDIVTSSEYSSRFVSMKELVYGSWNYGGTGQFTVQIGIMHFVGILLSLLAITKVRKQNKQITVFYLFTFLYFLFSLFIMQKQSGIIWTTFTTLQKFQFPWRFLSVSVFASSVLGAFLVLMFPQKFRVVLLGIFLFFILFLNKDYWHAKEYMQKPDSFYKSVYYGTTDTGESAPIWSVRFMEKEPKDTIEVIEGKANIEKLERNTSLHSYKIVAESSDVRIRENTLFFPGWKVLADGKDLSVEFQDPQHRGLMTFHLEKGKHTVQVRFEETKLRRLSNVISILSLIILLGYGFVVVMGRNFKIQILNFKRNLKFKY